MGFENGKLVGVRLRASDGPAHEAVSILHYNFEDVLTETNDPQTLADAFRDDVIPVMAGQCPESWTVDPVVVFEEKDPQDPTAPRSEWTSGVPVSGGRSTAGQDFAPYGICAIATLRTANIGRRFRGRMFIPIPLLDGDTTADQIVVGKRNDLNNFLDAIPRQPDLSTGADPGVEAHWCVYSRTQRGANLDPYANAVTSAQLRTTVVFLRSRSTGH